MSLHNPTIQESVENDPQPSAVDVSEETPEMRQKRDRELGMELFGTSHSALHAPEHKLLTSSPMIPARQDHHSTISKVNLTLHLDDIDMLESSWALKSPEQMDLDELEDLFTGF